MAQRLPCPSKLELEKLLFGQLPQAEIDNLESHFLDCERCLCAARSLDMRDTLVEALQQAVDLPDDLAEMIQPELVDRLCRLRPVGSARELDDSWEAVLGPPEGPNELGRVGPYRVLKRLGAGGMGVVYQAQDVRLKRVVALKMILTGPRASPERLSRFQREAELVSQLRHANIVQMYDVGEHAGRPYFTMELVNGGSLASRLAAGPLATGDAASLTATLARAVQHAHELGIVHRDLKPANVLLQDVEGSELRAEGPSEDGFGSTPVLTSASKALNPKITDFGLAKQLLNDSGESTQQYETQTGAILGTPSYMAPEQAMGKGDSIGPAVDVYALGVILYEAITGRPPFQAANPLETLEQVRTQEPVPPTRLQLGVPRDLETICLKCLAKTPSRRYRAAAELADDLQRFLRHEPILARPVPRLERLAKWARRNPAIALLIAVSTLFAIVAVIGVLIHDSQLRQSAVEARRQQERTELQYREARDTLRRMLDRATARFDAGIPKLSELRREQQQDSLSFFLKMAEQHDEDPSVRFDVAQSCHQAALLQNELGRPEEAVQNLRRAEKHLAALVAEFPNQQSYRLQHADTLKVLGGVGVLPPAEAEDCLHRALAITNDIVQAQPESLEIGLVDAHVRMTLGAIQFNNRDLAGAEDQFRRAASVYEKLNRDKPETAANRCVLAKAYVNLSVIMQNTNRSPHEFHDKAEATLEQLFGQNPDDGEVVTTLAMLRVNWAFVQEVEGKPDAALADLAKNVAMLEEALLREPKHAAMRDRLYRSFGVQSMILDNLGRFAESAMAWQRTVELSSSLPQADMHRLSLAMALAKAGQNATADSEIKNWSARAAADAPAEQFIHCAYVYSNAIAAMPLDDQPSVESRAESMTRYAAQAVDFLRRAKQSYGIDRWKSKVPELLEDEQLKPLRANADFQRLLSEKD